jgi:ornithine decarboxylase
MLLDQLEVKNLSAIHLSTQEGAFGISDDSIRKLNSAIPISILQPNLVENQAQQFNDIFPGCVMYAIKCNPDEIFLKAIYDGGVRSFDAASLSEIKLIRRLFSDIKVYFMHPIKSPEAIFEAYHNHQVKSFVLDYEGELDKILEVLPDAKDLELFVRIAMSQGNVVTDFSTKFGAKFDDAVELLKKCEGKCASLGLSFHVGTQCVNPAVYDVAIRYAASIINESNVKVEYLDIGGGFPADLNVDMPIPPLQNYMEMITNALELEGLENMRLLCEAGRGLVADGGSLVVRIEGRKDDILYINDGTYGGLFEAGGSIGLPYPARLVCPKNRNLSIESKAFRLAGPTCDSVDMMNGPFILPDDAQIGDWIYLNKLGAYGEVSRTNFNGFGKVSKIVIEK